MLHQTNKTMKTKQIIVTVAFAFIQLLGNAQNGTLTGKPVLAMVDFDTRGKNIDKAEMTQHIINELIRIGKYEVMDKYDIEFLAKRDTIEMTGCMSKICLIKAGKKLNANKMFSGYISDIADKTEFCIKLLDVQSGVVEKNVTKTFLKIPNGEFKMMTIIINEMFEIPNDPEMVKKLTSSEQLDNSINNPYKLKLRADGPRMGLTVFTGNTAEIIKSPISKGGFGGQPFMFQFGYQFEKQYLNEGNFQALFEVIPMVTGLDQGRVLPSITFMNGLRNNKNGFEFAFGPSFSFNKISKGYYDSTGNWSLVRDLPIGTDLTKFNVQNRLDSRGDYNISASFIFAVGRTFKSGKINLPVNFYFIPSLNGYRFGFSMGWNGKGRYE